MLVPFIGIAVVIVLSLLSGAAQRQKQQKKQRQEQNPFRQSQPQPLGDERPMYYDMPFAQAGGVQPPPGGKKKKKKSIPALHTEGRPEAEAPAIQKADTASGKTKSMPVFSQNPVVNGIIWAEILTRGGTKRKASR